MGGYSTTNSPHDNITFSPSADKYYLIGIDTYNDGITKGCDFTIEIDVYEPLIINGGGAPEYICEFPNGEGASLEFHVTGGRTNGQHEVYFSTTGENVLGYWYYGSEDSTTNKNDTLHGRDLFFVEGLEDGDEWSLSFEDGLGCGLSYSGKFSYNDFCNVCDKMTNLDIETDDATVCPSIPVELKPVANVEYPVPAMVVAQIDNFYSKQSAGGIDLRWLYDKPEEKQIVTDLVKYGTGGDAEVQDICFRMFAYSWDYMTVKLNTPCDGGGGSTYGGATEKSITLWQGKKDGGSDAAGGPGFWKNYGYGWMKFCASSGWKNQTMATDLASSWDGKSATEITKAFKGCDPNDGINFIVERVFGWGYTPPRDIQFTLLDQKNALSTKQWEERATEWTTQGIGDLSELTFPQEDETDTLKRTAIFLSDTPGEYRYDLFSYSDVGCRIGDNISYGPNTGDGTFRINVLAPAVINSIAANQDITNICIGKKVKLTANVTEGDNALASTSYFWKIVTNNDNAYLTGNHSNINYVRTTASGEIKIELTVIDEKGCPSSTEITMNVNPQCVTKTGAFN